MTMIATTPHQPPASIDQPAESLMALAEEYRLAVVELLHSRHAANARMLQYMTGRGGTLDEFETMRAAHEVFSADLTAAHACLGAAIDCEGAA